MFNQEDVLVKSIAVTNASTVTVSSPALTNICLSNKHIKIRNESPTSESVRFGIEHCNCIKEIQA